MFSALQIRELTLKKTEIQTQKCQKIIQSLTWNSDNDTSLCIFVYKNPEFLR